MKNLIRGFIFWTIALTFILIMFGIGQALANLLTMNFIMTVVYIALAFIFVMWTIAETLSKIVTINAIMNLVYVLLPACIVYILKN